MPRPKRPTGWNPITLTISDEVATALRVRAEIEHVEHGVLADHILRATLSPMMEQLKGMQKNLAIKPFPSADLSGIPQSAAGVASTPLGTSTAIVQEIPGDHFSDPVVRAEYEARFLDEVLAYVRSDLGWKNFLDGLEASDKSTRQEGSPLIQETDAEAEVNSWIKARHIPGRWKDHVYYGLGGDDVFTPEVFQDGLDPEDFFEWEQPKQDAPLDT